MTKTSTGSQVDQKHEDGDGKPAKVKGMNKEIAKCKQPPATVDPVTITDDDKCTQSVKTDLVIDATSTCESEQLDKPLKKEVISAEGEPVDEKTLKSDVDRVEADTKKALSKKPAEKQLSKPKQRKKGSGNGKPSRKSAEQLTPKITDFFPIRRSTRRLESELKKQQCEELSKAVLRNCEDGLKVIECPVKGRGVVADKVFSKGDFVVEYRGELIDRSTAKRREEEYAEDDDVGCYVYHFEFKGRRYCVDATAETPHLGRLVNHSAKKPNLITKVIDVNETPRLILVARQSISVGEELLYDYGDRSSAAIAANPWLTKS